MPLFNKIRLCGDKKSGRKDIGRFLAVCYLRLLTSVLVVCRLPYRRYWRSFGKGSFFNCHIICCTIYISINIAIKCI